MDITVIKSTINPEHVGREALLVLGVSGGKFSKIPMGSKCVATISEIPDKRARSHEQLALYWVSCRFISDSIEDNNFRTDEDTDEQTKLHLRHIKSYFYFQNQKTGESMLHIVTRSVSFAELKHLDACEYFTRAFDYHADLYNTYHRARNAAHRDISRDEYTELLKQYIANDYNRAVGL